MSSDWIYLCTFKDEDGRECHSQAAKIVDNKNFEGIAWDGSAGCHKHIKQVREEVAAEAERMGLTV